MQSDNNTIKISFFEDEDLRVGFGFKKPDQNNQKDLHSPAIMITKLARHSGPSTPLQQSFYALHNKTLAYHKHSINDQPEGLLNVSYAQLRFIPLNETTNLYGISLTKNGVQHELYSEEEGVIMNWINALKNVCVLTNFHEEYKALKMIGKGSFAKVYLVESKTTGKNFAVKAFTKESLIVSNKSNAKPSMINEIDIMRAIDHENVIKLYEVYETERSLYLVLELIQGKSLQDTLKKTGFKDNEARVINVMSSILDALAYLASKGIMHRDLKPDNILLDKGDKVKIVDFGLATFIDVPEYIFKKCGTPGYIAPEVFKYDQKNPATNYDDHCDAFSAGCIMFYMLFGFLFFDGPNASEILKSNRKFSVDFHALFILQEQYKSPSGKISKDALDLLIKLLEFNPKKRISSSQALNHPYLFSIMQQKIAGSFDVYQHGGCSPGIFDRRNSIADQHLQQQQQLKSGTAVNSPHRFAEKDSLYLDNGKPEITGRIDTLTSGSHNNSLLLTRTESNSATPNSAFSKNSPSTKSFRAGHGGPGNQSVLKAAIFRNMQKNNEETKDDNDGLPEVKHERRHSDYIKLSHTNESPKKSTSPDSDGEQANQQADDRGKRSSLKGENSLKRWTSTHQAQDKAI